MNSKCQVFTPQDYVKVMLDSLDYKHNLFGKKIMENSCGDGNILLVVVQRYIDDCRNKGFSTTKIRNGLSKDIAGFEIDSKQYEKCIQRLNALIDKNNIPSVTWNIRCEDYLRAKDADKYDYIVGNPPYITYSELEHDEQKYLKKKFTSCSEGKFDYYYAFIEKGINTLSNLGRMAYLIPSSVYKTVFGRKIRNIMLPLVESIIDYTQEKLFADALVKSSIIVFDKTNSINEIKYVNTSLNSTELIKRSSLNEKWSFKEIKKGTKRFGDYFRVSHSVATLYNSAFVLSDWKIDKNGNYICNGITIEKSVVREAASPKNMRNQKDEKIIFPYSYDNNHNLIRYDEVNFKERFPGAYKYLSQNKKPLKKRKKDKSSLWFEYGRSQALAHLDYDKAMISTIISGKPNIYKLKKDCVPYAGMYIIPLSDNYSVEDAITILQEKDFMDYVSNIGIPINGNSVRVTSKDIENYWFK